MEKYSKVRNIGKGTMGACALALNNVDGNYYVIKQVDLRRMSKKERRQGLNEARLLSQLRHPNIIDYVDSFLAKKSDHLCIVMEYAEGGDLKSRIKKRCGVNFSETQVLDWFIQLVLSLHYVHQRKILHRDVKSQNVFLTAEDVIKLGDFGIARTLNGTFDQAQTFVGTPYYLSPELLLERPYDHRSDVWALGVVLYEMLTLQQPFNANDMRGLMQRILKVQYSPVSAAYSDEMRKIVSRLLMKEPSQRMELSEILELPLVHQRLQTWLKGNVVPQKYLESLVKNNLLPVSVLREGRKQRTSLRRNKLCTPNNNLVTDSREVRALPSSMPKLSSEVKPVPRLGQTPTTVVSSENRYTDMSPPTCTTSNPQEPDQSGDKPGGEAPQASAYAPSLLKKLNLVASPQAGKHRIASKPQPTTPPPRGLNGLDALYHDLLNYHPQPRMEPVPAPAPLPPLRVLTDLGRLREARCLANEPSPWYLSDQPLQHPKSSPVPVSVVTDRDGNESKPLMGPQLNSLARYQNPNALQRPTVRGPVVTTRRLKPLFWPCYSKETNPVAERGHSLSPLYSNPPANKPSIDIKALLQKAALERAQRRLKGAF